MILELINIYTFKQEELNDCFSMMIINRSCTLERKTGKFVVTRAKIKKKNYIKVNKYHFQKNKENFCFYKTVDKKTRTKQNTMLI